MAATTAIPVAHITVGEYLASVYRPDVDYVDGVLEERNVGEMDHATVQKLVLLALSRFEEEAGVYAIQEVRVQVAEAHFRVPDICLIPANQVLPDIVTEPPLLCVEVLSPKDTLPQMRRRCLEYIHMGVARVWIFNPRTETAYVQSVTSFDEVNVGELTQPNTPVRVTVGDLYMAARKRLGRVPR